MKRKGKKLTYGWTNEDAKYRYVRDCVCAGKNSDSSSSGRMRKSFGSTRSTTLWSSARLPNAAARRLHSHIVV